MVLSKMINDEGSTFKVGAKWVKVLLGLVADGFCH